MNAAATSLSTPSVTSAAGSAPTNTSSSATHSPHGAETHGARPRTGRTEVGTADYELVSCRQFKPHALTQPTLFSTRDSADYVPAEGLPAGRSKKGHYSRLQTSESTGAQWNAVPDLTGGDLNIDQDNDGAGVQLLNAWEKIEELEGLVESSRSHNER